MRRTESEAGKGEEFSLDGQTIGGPKEFWKRITNDEVPVKGAWEFTNQRGQNDQLEGYNFHFPRGSRIDIYVEEEGEQKIFTAMGGNGANLDPRWKVTEMQLYINSRKWEEQHEGEWMEWKNDGTRLNPTNEWRTVGTTPPKRVEAPYYAPTPDAPPPVNSSWTEQDKQNAKRALRWALAGVLVLGGIGVWSSMQKSQNNTEPYVPNVTTELAPTIEPEYTYETYDLKFGDTWTVPTNSIVAIPYGSGIVVSPPAAVNKTQISYSKVDGTWFAYDYIVINVGETPLTISTPSDLNLYTRDVIVEYNIKTRNNDSIGGYYDRKILGTDNILDFEYTLDFRDETIDHNLCTGWPGVSCTILK